MKLKRYVLGFGSDGSEIIKRSLFSDLRPFGTAQSVCGKNTRAISAWGSFVAWDPDEPRQKTCEACRKILEPT